jgi:hypothetical protein
VSFEVEAATALIDAATLLAEHLDAALTSCSMMYDSMCSAGSSASASM